MDDLKNKSCTKIEKDNIKARADTKCQRILFGLRKDCSAGDRGSVNRLPPGSGSISREKDRKVRNYHSEKGGAYYTGYWGINGTVSLLS